MNASSRYGTPVERPRLPLVALPAGNPLILKQIEEAAERRKTSQVLVCIAERRRQLKRMGR